MDASIDTNAIVSTIPQTVWDKLHVQAVFTHWRYRKPVGLARFTLRGHAAVDGVVIEKGPPVLSLPLLTSMDYSSGEKETLQWHLPRV